MMTIYKTILCTLAALAVAWVAAPVGAEDTSKQEPAAETATDTSAQKPPSLAADKAVSAPPPAAGGMPIYKPPMLGKPTRTVGGGSRGTGDSAPSLYAIVPNHVAQTASQQPSLFWYVDGVPPASAKVEFTLIDDESVDPQLEATLETPKRPGLHRIRLADHGVTLTPGNEYEWSVSIIVDPNDRSKDIVATGWIDCVARTDGLAARLASEGETRSVHVFAEEGLWYDALTALGDQMQRNPGDPELKEIRSSLLHQVGLDTVATAPVL